MSRHPDSGGLTEARFDALLAGLLRAGVVLSAAIVAGGGGLFLARHGLQHPDYRMFRGEPDFLRTIGGTVSAARRLDGSAVIQVGLLILIATPIARVVLSVTGFARQRDWLYVAITLVVLLLLIYSLTSG